MTGTMTNFQRYRLKRIVVLFLMLVVFSWNAFAQEVSITTPISGTFAIPNGLSDLVLLDTATGTTVHLADQNGSMTDPKWSPDGAHVAFTNLFTHISIYDAEAQTIQSIEILPSIPAEDFFIPIGWFANGTDILYMQSHAATDGSATTQSTFYQYDTGDHTLIPTGFSFTGSLGRGVPLPDFIQHPDGVAGILSGAMSIQLNPVYNQWLALSMTIEAADETIENTWVLVVLYNYQTRQTIPVNVSIGQRALFNPQWSQDGNRLSVEAEELYILDFSPENGSVALSKHGRAPSIRQWLGVDDLLISQTFYIGQMIDGTWHHQQWFQFPTEGHTQLGLRGSSFFLIADQTERHTLSCLFDQAQPTRLSIDEPARVNFTTGTPLRLRAEPDLNLDPIQQMPEGTEFDVIGGPACVNAATDYYRFWQIKLSDSTVGWAAEAGMTDYFMEPLDG